MEILSFRYCNMKSKIKQSIKYFRNIFISLCKLSVTVQIFIKEKLLKKVVFCIWKIPSVWTLLSQKWNTWPNLHNIFIYVNTFHSIFFFFSGWNIFCFLNKRKICLKILMYEVLSTLHYTVKVKIYILLFIAWKNKNLLN